MVTHVTEIYNKSGGGRRSCDHMVVGFTTTYAIGARQLMKEVGME
jgi:hypothetical protein